MYFVMQLFKISILSFSSVKITFLSLRQLLSPSKCYIVPESRLCIIAPTIHFALIFFLRALIMSIIGSCISDLFLETQIFAAFERKRNGPKLFTDLAHYQLNIVVSHTFSSLK